MSTPVLVFDVLGTVLDERRGFRSAVESLGPSIEHPTELADRWLDRVSTLTGDIASGKSAWRPWEDLIDEALAEVAPDLHAGPEAGTLTTVGRRLPPWPDSPPAIRTLRQEHRVVALSNAGVLPLIESSRGAGLTWDGVLSAGMVRSTKPDPRVYRFLLDQLRLEPAELLMVAAHPWDLRAAAGQGLRTAFVSRPGEGTADDPGEFDLVVTGLAELASVL